MRKSYRCFAVLILAAVFFCGSFQAFAAYDGGFVVTPFDEEKKNAILENVKIDVVNQEPRKQRITAFGVTSGGMIAVVMKDYYTTTICVYDHNGIYQYGYKTDTHGRTGVEFCGEELYIYYSVSDLIHSVDESGKLKDLWNVESSQENYSYAVYDELGIYSKKKSIDGLTYEMTNGSRFSDFFSSSYAKILVTDANGSTHVIYDAGSIIASRIHILIEILIPAIAFTVWLIYTFSKIRKTRKRIR